MNHSKLRKIGLLGLIAILGFGLLVGYATSRFVQTQAINVSSNLTASLLESIILHNLQDSSDLPAQLDAHTIKQQLKSVSGIKNVLDVRILNAEDQAVAPTNLKAVLAGQYQAELSFTKSATKNLLGTVPDSFQVTIPLRQNPQGKILGALQVDFATSEMTQASLGIFYTVLAVLSVGFILVYAAMYTILKRLIILLDKKDNTINKYMERLEVAQLDKEKAYTGTIQSLLAALDAKDRYTAGHSLRVADYALKIGARMDLPDDSLELIEKAALFHDIGKIAVPEWILNKPEMLTTEEYEIIKKHAAIGEQILSVNGYLSAIAKVIRHHHERIDGMGYPDGLTGDAIPLESQVLAVADTYDALTSDRPYRQGLSALRALQLMQNISGSQLNPQMVNLLIEIVQTEDDRVTISHFAPNEEMVPEY